MISRLRNLLAPCLYSIVVLVAAPSMTSQTTAGSGIISTYAGSGTTYNCPAFYGPPNCPQIGAYGFKGDGSAATDALLFNPGGIALDAQGDLFIADANNHRVREVTPDGDISTIAGNGDPGFSGDGGPATTAELDMPQAVAVDAAGDVYIADWGNCRIREVTPPGVIQTIAGNGTEGYSGDGGPATAAMLGHVLLGIALDAAGNVYFSDVVNSRIRMVAPNGVISTVAGNGGSGFSGDGGPAASAALNHPFGVATDANGNLFFVDSDNNCIRKIAPNGWISTVVAGLSSPLGLTVDSAGNIFIADLGSNTVKEFSTSGQLSVVAGSGAFGPPTGDGGPATQAVLYAPSGVAIDGSGNLFIDELENSRIRRVAAVGAPGVFPAAAPSAVPPAPFAINSGGGVSLTSSGTSQATEESGYAEIIPDSGSTTPNGLAIFANRENGVLISEASVPASPLIQSGRILAEMYGPLDTGLAIVNPSNQPATVSFYFTDSNGNNSTADQTVIPANGKIAAFLSESPFHGASSFTGSFTFSSSVPVAAVALQGWVNERSEFLMTTIPVTDLSAAPNSFSQVLPHFADGGGWTTEVALVNQTDTILTGAVGFSASVTIAGQTGSSFPYSIPPRTSEVFQTADEATAIATGWVSIAPTSGTSTPAGVAIFSFRNNGVSETEAAVPAVLPAAGFQLYAENSGSFLGAGSIQTGVALVYNGCKPSEVNPSLCGPAVDVTLELHNLDGSPTGLTGTVSVPSGGHVALFLNQIPGFQSLPANFQGILNVTTASSSETLLSVVGLRGRYNERGDFLITTLNPLPNVASTTPLYFPHVVDSGGYTTQFVLYSSSSGESGVLKLFSAAGTPLNIVLH